VDVAAVVDRLVAGRIRVLEMSFVFCWSHC
jgi:hypothetical protein